MRTDQKDKRTKPDILKLLDRALENEERLAAKIQTVEQELVECKKKSADPGYELTDKALPASKVSFRIDYYRTAAKGPLKGVIQHLSSQEKRSFEGKGVEAIGDFMGKYVPAEKKATAAKPVVQQPVATPETPSPEPPVIMEHPAQSKASPTAQAQAATPLPIGRTRLLDRLKAEIRDETFSVVRLPEKPVAMGLVATEKPPRSPRIQRILAHLETGPQPIVAKEKPQPAESARTTPLLMRLRTDYLTSVAANK